VKRGIARSEIKADTDPVQLAVVIMSMIEGAILQAKVHGRSTELKIAMDYLAAIIEATRK
jgi:hypothetical protein